MEELYDIDISDLGADGQGIGRLPSGKTVFIEGVFPGERCSCRITSQTSKYAVGEALDLLVASSDRTGNFVRVSGLSGSMPLAALSYEAQLRYKKKKVGDCLVRIGGLAPDRVSELLHDTIPCDPPKRYRNHMQYSIVNGRAGLLASHSSELGEYNAELIEYEIFSGIREYVENGFRRCPTRLFEGLVLRGSERTKEVMAEFVSGNTAPHEITIRDCRDYLDRTGLLSGLSGLCEDGGFRLVSVTLRMTGDKVSRRTRRGKRVIISGNDYYDEIFCGRRFRIKAGAFFQVNIPQAEKLIDIASAVCRGAGTIYDLYCGAGSIGLSLVSPGQKLLGIEVVPEAVASAKINRGLALSGGEQDCEFICRDVLKTDFAAMIAAGRIPAPDALAVDPPRAGLNPGVIRKIADLAPSDIAYISCDPATLARDLKQLSAKYVITCITPVDMFPHTSSIETVVLLSKLSSAKHHVTIDLGMDELDITASESKATYSEIKTYVMEHTGLNVTNLNIAQVKRKCGIIERENYNLPKSEDSRQPNCTSVLYLNQL